MWEVYLSLWCWSHTFADSNYHPDVIVVVVRAQDNLAYRRMLADKAREEAELAALQERVAGMEDRDRLQRAVHVRVSCRVWLCVRFWMGTLDGGPTPTYTCLSMYVCITCTTDAREAVAGGARGQGAERGDSGHAYGGAAGTAGQAQVRAQLCVYRGLMTRPSPPYLNPHTQTHDIKK